MRMTANLKSPLPLHQRLSPYHLVQIGLRHLSFHFRQKVAVQVRLLYIIYKTALLALECKYEDKLDQKKGVILQDIVLVKFSIQVFFERFFCKSSFKIFLESLVS